LYRLVFIPLALKNYIVFPAIKGFQKNCFFLKRNMSSQLALTPNNSGPRQTMEDRFVIDTLEESIVFGVFDGHCGVAAADLCASSFSSVFASCLQVR
jgi:hypothetical protein